MRRHLFAMVFVIALITFPTQAQRIGDKENFTLTLNIGSYDQDGLIANFIKTSLAPLKINVEIGDQGDWLGKLGKSPGDMHIHTYSYPQSEYPHRMWTESGLVPKFYNYDDPGFQAQLLEDTGMTLDDVAALEDSYLYAETREEAMVKSDEFVKIFNEKLLFSLPLVNPDPTLHLVDEAITGYSSLDSLYGSIFRGMTIDEEISGGEPDTLRLKMSASSSSGFATFPSMVASTYRDVLSGILPTSLSMFLVDGSGDLHPHMVKNIDKQDWVQPDGTTIPNGKTVLTFYSGLNMTSDFGLPPGWETFELGPRDILMRIQLEQAYHKSANYDLGLSDYLFDIDDEARQLIIYEERPRIDTLEKLNHFAPVPERYLNTTLYTPIMNGTIFELAEQGISPYSTLEFYYFRAYTGGLYLTGGPYNIGAPLDGDWIVTQRENYHFPNEWDTDDFIIDTNEVEDAYYFAYNTTENEPERKPTQFGIKTIRELGYHPNNPGLNSTDSEYYPYYQKDANNEYANSDFLRLDLMNNDVIDFTYINPIRLGKSEVYRDMLDNEGYEIDNHRRNDVTAEYLWFNPESIPLQRLDLRLAIAHALDRETMAETISQFSYVVNYHAGIFPGMDQFVNDNHPILYDYPEARDLMRSMGYVADDSPEYPVALSQTTLNFVEITADNVILSILPISVAILASPGGRNRLRKKSARLNR